jgi:hypothetical protein
MWAVLSFGLPTPEEDLTLEVSAYLRLTSDMRVDIAGARVQNAASAPRAHGGTATAREGGSDADNSRQHRRHW